MARHELLRRVFRRALLAPAFALATGAWMAGGASAEAGRMAVLVRVHDLGLERASTDEVKVLVWASGSAKVGIGNAELAPLTDTLRLSSLPAFTADVSEADVHVRLLTPGRMRLGADVSGGRAIRFTATGRHIVLLKGGTGADTITDP